MSMELDFVYFAEFKNESTVFTKTIDAVSLTHASVIAEELAEANNWVLLGVDYDVA